MQMNTLVRGALAGLVATAPLTLVQLLGLRLFPGKNPDGIEPGGPDEWTPQHVTHKVMEAVHLEEETRAVRTPLAVVAHYGYGASAGALYGAWRGDREGHFSNGVAFGVGVWTLSYLGWVPFAGVLPLPQEDPNRAARLLLGHVVFGTVLSVVYDRL